VVSAIPLFAAGLIGIANTARAETALQAASNCRPIVSAARTPDNKIIIPHTHTSGWCWGAFASIQGLARFAEPDGIRLFGICVPENASRSQFIAIFVQYTDKHPERGHFPFEEVAIEALAAAFPCAR
jgi:hypothetical protein